MTTGTGCQPSVGTFYRIWQYPFCFFGAVFAHAESTYPDLRDAHDPELQKAMDNALGPSHPEFWSGVKKKEFGVVVADVTDLHRPRAAWYNPELMLYAASLPKIAIVLGIFVEIERGVIQLDAEIRNQLIRMIRNSSNRDATALMLKVGYERLAEILRSKWKFIRSVFRSYSPPLHKISPQLKFRLAASLADTLNTTRCFSNFIQNDKNLSSCIHRVLHGIDAKSCHLKLESRI